MRYIPAVQAWNVGAVLHFLASEELIETDKEGFIHWRG